jgi:hypothetical protein
MPSIINSTNMTCQSSTMPSLHCLKPNKRSMKVSRQDDMKWFHVSKDVLESHMGRPIILTKVVEAMPGYNNSVVSTHKDT